MPKRRDQGHATLRTSVKKVTYLSIVLQALDDLGSHPVGRAHDARSLVLLRRQRRRETEVGELDPTFQVHLPSEKEERKNFPSGEVDVFRVLAFTTVSNASLYTLQG